MTFPDIYLRRATKLLFSEFEISKDPSTKYLCLEDSSVGYYLNESYLLSKIIVGCLSSKSYAITEFRRHVVIKLISLNGTKDEELTSLFALVGTRYAISEPLTYISKGSRIGIDVYPSTDLASFIFPCLLELIRV
jgi:hypothetical protein